MYHRPGLEHAQSFVRDPAGRMADGFFLGLQHPDRDSAIDDHGLQDPDRLLRERRLAVAEHPEHGVGILRRRASTYRPRRRTGCTTAPSCSRTAPTTSSCRSRWPSRPTSPQDASGKINGNLRFGGADVATAQSNMLYNNGAVFGANDWTWREESGDWRFYFIDVAKAPPPGTLFLTDTDWDDPAPYTDLDTLIFGPVGERVPGVRLHVADLRAVHPRHRRSERPCLPRHGHVGLRHGHRRRRGVGHRAGPGGPARGRAAPGGLRRGQVPRPVRDATSGRRASRRRAWSRRPRPTRALRRHLRVDARPARADGRGATASASRRRRSRRRSRTTRTTRRRRASRSRSRSTTPRARSSRFTFRATTSTCTS